MLDYFVWSVEARYAYFTNVCGALLLVFMIIRAKSIILVVWSPQRSATGWRIQMHNMGHIASVFSLPESTSMYALSPQSIKSKEHYIRALLSIVHNSIFEKANDNKLV